jgi:exoribonuclease-2
VRLGEVDEITLDIHGTVVERLDDPNDASDDAPWWRTRATKTPQAGPIAIAVDVNEADSTAPANADNPTP